VVGVADGAGGVSQQVLEAAGTIGEEATKLRNEVDQFLRAVREDTGERRLYDPKSGSCVVALRGRIGGRWRDGNAKAGYSGSPAG
jgi:methyl-accepting chemotaxis protein